MRPGDVYNDSKFKKAYEKLRDVYGSLGYFQWTGGTQRKPDPEKKVVDMTVRMEEDKQYFLGRINFTGNDSTRDKVIRREIYMNEGEVFNTEALKMSIKRVNQLGYFKQMEGAPDIRPSETADNKVDVTFKVEEQNRNQFTFGGGVSGYEGAFLNASFSTTNFLGAGETVSLAVQTGSRTKNYSLSVSEPYFLDRPITAGLNVFLSRITYLSYGTTVVGYGQQSQGIGVTAGIPVGHFSRVFASYSYQIIDIYDVDRDTVSRLVGSTLRERQHAPHDRPGLLRRHRAPPRERHQPLLRPQHRGQPVPAAQRLALHGELPVRGRPAAGHGGLRAPQPGARALPAPGPAHGPRRARRGRLHRPFGDTTGIPYYQRYFLGGETQIRGYNVRSVAPYDELTKTSVGGNKFLLFNAEYYFDVFGPLRLLLFFDAGQAYAPGQGIYWKTMSTSTGVEARFIDARPQRAVPTHLRLEPQPRLLPAGDGVQVRGGDDLLNPRRTRHERALPAPFCRSLASPALGACNSPTESDPSFDVTFTANPDPATASGPTGVKYKVTNADDTVSYYEYDYRTHFTVTIKEKAGLALNITSINLTLQQATGGIVIPPSGGDQVYFKFNSSAAAQPHQREGLRGRRLRRLVRPSEPGPRSPGHRVFHVRLRGQDDNTYTYSDTSRSRWRRSRRAGGKGRGGWPSGSGDVAHAERARLGSCRGGWVWRPEVPARSGSCLPSPRSH